MLRRNHSSQKLKLLLLLVTGLLGMESIIAFKI